MHVLNISKLAEIKCLFFLHSHCAGKASLVKITSTIIFLKLLIVLFFQNATDNY
jgi:hypothetical protein